MLKIIYYDNLDLINFEINKTIKFKKVNVELTIDNINSFSSEISTIDLFGEQKSFIIYGIDFFSIKSSKFKKEDIKFFLNQIIISEDQFYILIDKKINRSIEYFLLYEKYIEYLEVTSETIKPFNLIKQYSVNNNILISDQMINALLDLNDDNFLLVKNEVDKLFAFTNQNEITIDHINSFAIKTKVANAFNLINFLLGSKFSQSHTLYNKLISDGQNPASILGLLYTQIKFFRQVKLLSEKYDTNNIASLLKVNPYRIKKTLEVIGFIPLYKIDSLFLKIANADYKLKSGQINDQLIFDYLYY